MFAWRRCAHPFRSMLYIIISCLNALGHHSLWVRAKWKNKIIQSIHQSKHVFQSKLRGNSHKLRSFYNYHVVFPSEPDAATVSWFSKYLLHTTSESRIWSVWYAFFATQFDKKISWIGSANRYREIPTFTHMRVHLGAKFSVRGLVDVVRTVWAWI